MVKKRSTLIIFLALSIIVLSILQAQAGAALTCPSGQEIKDTGEICLKPSSAYITESSFIDCTLSAYISQASCNDAPLCANGFYNVQGDGGYNLFLDLSSFIQGKYTFHFTFRQDDKAAQVNENFKICCGMKPADCITSLGTKTFKDADYAQDGEQFYPESVDCPSPDPSNPDSKKISIVGIGLGDSSHFEKFRIETCAPSASPSCNNDGDIDPGEDCDSTAPDPLNGEDCTKIPGGFTGGTLTCKPDCTFDTSGCAMPVTTATNSTAILPFFSPLNLFITVLVIAFIYLIYHLRKRIR